MFESHVDRSRSTHVLVRLPFHRLASFQAVALHVLRIVYTILHFIEDGTTKQQRVAPRARWHAAAAVSERRKMHTLHGVFSTGLGAGVGLGGPKMFFIFNFVDVPTRELWRPSALKTNARDANLYKGRMNGSGAWKGPVNLHGNDRAQVR
ncbi:hypothetical protein EVAR_86295_1 [Eumeta japonica]|uniref:Uncharacterized protein n=1 Tax=Eumeta variegata TaxID=151549 RepID=A0A4C1X4Q6_EUMVA|nr:hypothetical protein EVAR_86295_1 [Eumeta japonica]